MQTRLLKHIQQPARTLPERWHRFLFRGLALFGGLGMALAQSETEIYLLPLQWEGGSVTCGVPENVTQNPGYDNQPAFAEDGTLLYASTRNGQTDIARLNLSSRASTWLSDTPWGGEYSPLPVPGGQAVSAIRLDTSGLQRLYEYRDGASRMLFPDLKVGYQVWAGPDVLVCTVLVEDRMDLVRAATDSQTTQTLRQGVGRSLSRIPASDRISFTARDDVGLWLWSLEPESGATERITRLPDTVQDICWLPDGSLLCGGEGVLRRLLPEEGATWEVFHTFSPGFGTISRLAVNETGSLLALVVEPNP